MSNSSLCITEVHETEKQLVPKLEKPLKCNFCDYQSSRKGHINRHIRAVHENLKPFECDVCYRSFATESNLGIHKASVHEKIKPFQCGHGDHKFSIKGDMISFHEESCKICKAIFTTESGLYFHIASVHEKEKPYQCVICNCNCLRNSLACFDTIEVNKQGCNICGYECLRKSKMDCHKALIAPALKSCIAKR